LVDSNIKIPSDVWFGSDSDTLVSVDTQDFFRFQDVDVGACFSKDGLSQVMLLWLSIKGELPSSLLLMLFW